jgi:hypothetical protein
MLVRSTRSVFLSILILLVSAAAFAQIGIGITVSFGPPALPIYVQPPCPAAGYIWAPGYWAWDPNFGDYFWVPGTWVLAPAPGLLWTPGYWAWNGRAFFFHEGYWGPIVGFYGGINYGFGYFGEGYQGGRWDHGQFYYNRAVNNVNVTNIHNVYNTTIVNNTTVNRVSYNGGPGGVNARPTAQDEAASRASRLPPVEAQTRHLQTASANLQLRASQNQGMPPIAATDRPGAFSGGSVVAAQRAGAPFHPPANQGANRPSGSAATRPVTEAPAYPVHAKDLPPHPQPAAPNTGNAKLDQEYERQQQKLYAQQAKEHLKLQQQQEKDHQRAAQQRASEGQTQQLEQKHQQQTQQMEERHAQQQQQLQMRQAPLSAHGQPPQR